MLNVLRGWIHRYFSDEEAVVLGVLLIVAFATILTLGHMLAPVFAGLVMAFLMQGLVGHWSASSCRILWRSGWFF